MILLLPSFFCMLHVIRKSCHSIAFMSFLFKIMDLFFGTLLWLCSCNMHVLLLASNEYKYLITSSPSKRITPRKRNFISVIKPRVFSSGMMSTARDVLMLRACTTPFNMGSLEWSQRGHVEKIQEMNSSWKVCLFTTFHTRCLLAALMIQSLRIVPCNLSVVSYTWKTELVSQRCTCPKGFFTGFRMPRDLSN